jgi:hypothetical protein
LESSVTHSLRKRLVSTLEPIHKICMPDLSGLYLG